MCERRRHCQCRAVLFVCLNVSSKICVYVRAVRAAPRFCAVICLCVCETENVLSVCFAQTLGLIDLMMMGKMYFLIIRCLHTQI